MKKFHLVGAVVLISVLCACSGTSTATAPTTAMPTATTPRPPASQPSSATDDVLGIWKGTYTCQQGLTGVTLDIIRAQSNDSSLDAEFDFYAVAANPGVPSGSGTQQGTYTAGHLILTWQAFTAQPAGYGGVNLNGSVSGSGATQALSGTVAALSGGNACTTFSLTRASSTGTSTNG
jgi:hypothetical protein